MEHHRYSYMQKISDFFYASIRYFSITHSYLVEFSLAYVQDPDILLLGGEVVKLFASIILYSII